MTMIKDPAALLVEVGAEAFPNAMQGCLDSATALLEPPAETPPPHEESPPPPEDARAVRRDAWGCSPRIRSHFGSVFYRVGKRAAGRLLDGREWNELPGEGE